MAVSPKEAIQIRVFLCTYWNPSYDIKVDQSVWHSQQRLCHMTTQYAAVDNRLPPIPHDPPFIAPVCLMLRETALRM
jgi:hypothetical protein